MYCLPHNDASRCFVIILLFIKHTEALQVQKRRLIFFSLLTWQETIRLINDNHCFIHLGSVLALQPVSVWIWILASPDFCRRSITTLLEHEPALHSSTYLYFILLIPWRTFHDGLFFQRVGVLGRRTQCDTGDSLSILHKSTMQDFSGGFLASLGIWSLHFTWSQAFPVISLT